MRVLLFLLLSVTLLKSQEKLTSWYGEIEGKEDLLNQIKQVFKIDAEFVLLHEIESKAGKHFLYQQIINDIPVYNGGLKINIDNTGSVRSVFNYSYDESLVIAEGQDFDVYYFANGSIYEAQYSKVLKEDYHVEILNYSAGSFEKPLMCLYTDTIINVGVFEPDPLTSSGNEYGGDYIDNSDANSSFLNDQIVNRTINARYDNGTFLLENDYIVMMDLSNPIQTVVTSNDPNFLFTRSDDEFEEVNAFYHISNLKLYFESIGLDTLMNYQIQVDAHALNGSDNSMFVSSFDPPRLLFGDGGVDDAEDADVIIHEYGHAISYYCAPNTNSGLERNTLDEANGDYFAASYSKNISTYNWGDVYSWDGHNEYWSGRVVITDDHYPQDLIGNRYNDADIWAATIMQIHDEIGREETDKILIESMYSYASYMSMTDAARLFVQADSILNDGSNYQVILTHMANRGLLPWDTINGVVETEISSCKVWSENDDIYFENNIEDLSVQVFTIEGKLIKTEFVNANERLLYLDLENQGVYLLVITDPKGGSKTLKLVIN